MASEVQTGSVGAEFVVRGGDLRSRWEVVGGHDRWSRVVRVLSVIFRTLVGS